ncbi:D-alanyl-D-alanine carboxypeptidase [Nesterenkonia alkaliphila]|uniref:Serine hydrolase n=1 Tax=Nesterenkonia alkaliphila TaxID=1463631 RepID=A0A7K1UID2_9MICC|nr:D-alanyl-D-alanine carboxypeptidase [Nesterenkonia alkaliphila]MVT26228.1 hypothetical protein [Nesterenkonia alkaliphila]GFZ84578.1 hypothetical protein GCM10011359_11970 [Nesterenkonia alkaliphila]
MAPEPVTPEELRSGIRSLFAPEAAAGAYAIDLRTGAVLASWQESTPRMMASTAKLFTIGAALQTLPVRGHERTELLQRCAAAGRKSDNTVADELAEQISRYRRGLIRPRRPNTAHGAQLITRHVSSVVRRSTQGRAALQLGAEYRQIDGSGYRFANRASPRLVAEYLAAMAAAPGAAEFTASLAVMGRSGTLRSRGRGEGITGLVLGKTGTHLTPKSEGYPRGMRSSALSGYCLAGPEGTPVVAFAVMQERPESKAAAKALEDQAAGLLSRWAVA